MADEVRLIDVDALKKAIELLCEDERTNMTAIAYFALRELVDTMPTIEAAPCTFCAYNPPSSSDGKPCTICPAVAKKDNKED